MFGKAIEGIKLAFRICFDKSNKGERIKRLIKAIFLQLRKRIFCKNKIWIEKLFNGAYIYFHGDSVCSSMVIYFKIPDFEDISYLRANIKSDDVIMDIGANIGHVSLLLSDLVPFGKMYLFEPHPETYAILKDNISLNTGVNVRLYNCALADFEGEIGFTDFKGNASALNRIELNKVSTLNVKCHRLDNIIENEGIKKVDIIKIDVEGFELQVLKGFSKYLKIYQPRIIMFEVNKTYLEKQKDDIFRFLEENLYKIGTVSNLTFYPDRFIDGPNCFAVHNNILNKKLFYVS